ncbi:acylglycerol kinase, mitochondrial isoform X2 [Takifugu flavidus]|uniref:acylglycerol kinase, mitochondrial isoform X2 n=1 Tax=Takifugu flavidus TaxID=433684 RepID=UPI002544211F|nr:acylglycerol kinase, mitochondrial isoform X2 [Takifugu flavidus]
MARVVKVFRTLRNHWKKSAFAVCVLSYGGHWLYGKHCDNILRREACLLARDFGRQLMAPQEQLRKATVILNPAACNGKANNLFEKNAAPILHLAGVEITLVKTDYEGQAKKLMELLEHTDMLIVAGGDGTMQEVITGLLRRPDQEKMSGIPIGFIPLGSTNSLSPSLHLLNDNKVKDITSATLSILRGVTVPLDVLQIKGEKDQPVFALMGLQWGAFRDAASKISKYWYLGPLKTYAAHWFSTLREWPLVRDISISHLAPTLRPPDQPFEKPPRPSLLYRIARRLKNYWNPPIEEPPKLEEPEQWKEEKLSTLELLVQTHNNNPVERRINDSLVIHAEPDNFSVADFITVGNAKTKDPIIFSKNSTILEASACRLQLPEGAGGFYNIDNEEYEAMPVEVRLLPRKLRFFISAERRAQFLSLTQGEKDIKNDNSTETT